MTNIQEADADEIARDLAESVTHVAEVAEGVGEIVTNVFVEEIDFDILSVYMASEGHVEDVVQAEEKVKMN